MNKHFLVIVFLISVFTANAQAPSRIFSPYSQNGIGELQTGFYARNFGIANIGISNSNIHSANMLNPALLEKNKYTIFDVNSGFKQSSTTLDTSLQVENGGGLKALAMVMPINYKWTTAFSLTPFSEINYQAKDYSFVNGDTLINAEGEKGNMQRVAWANGINILKGLNIGFGIGYVFGNTKTENISVLSSGKSNIIRQSRNKNISGFDYELGISYSHLLNLSKNDSNKVIEKETVYKLNNKIIKNIAKLSDEEVLELDTIIQDRAFKERKYTIDLGVVYNGSTKLNTTSIRRNDFVDEANLYNLTYTDTSTGTISIPDGFGFGITIGNLSEKSRWKLSLESTFKNWSKAKENGISLSLKDMNRYVIGFEYTPVVNSYSNGVIGLLERTTYSTGVYQKRSIYVVNGKQLEEVGMHFGISFVERQKRLGNRSYRWESFDKNNSFKETRHYLSRINIGFAMGTLGANESTAIQQLFFKLNIGISLNSEWFVKRKIN